MTKIKPVLKNSVGLTVAALLLAGARPLQAQPADGGQVDLNQLRQIYQQGMAGGASPAQMMQQLRGAGFDPAQMIEQMRQRGVDVDQMMQRARDAGIDTTQFGVPAAGAGVANPQAADAFQSPGAAQAFRSMVADPEQILDRMVDSYQALLEFGDPEWVAIRPLVRDLLAKQRSARQGAGIVNNAGNAGFGGRFVSTATMNAQQTPTGGAADDLNNAIDSQAPAKEILAKLKAYQAAKKQDADQLKQAQEKLRGVLSVRREAKAVLAGLLD